MTRTEKSFFETRRYTLEIQRPLAQGLLVQVQQEGNPAALSVQRRANAAELCLPAGQRPKRAEVRAPTIEKPPAPHPPNPPACVLAWSVCPSCLCLSRPTQLRATNSTSPTARGAGRVAAHGLRALPGRVRPGAAHAAPGSHARTDQHHVVSAHHRRQRGRRLPGTARVGRLGRHRGRAHRGGGPGHTPEQLPRTESAPDSGDLAGDQGRARQLRPGLFE